MLTNAELCTPGAKSSSSCWTWPDTTRVCHSRVMSAPRSATTSTTEQKRLSAPHTTFLRPTGRAFGQQERPFVGWLMVVEDAPASRATVQQKSPHFPVFPDFVGASYLKRYDILCQKLAREQLYSSAAVIATPRTAVVDGEFVELSPMTGLRSFVASLAGHIAAEAAR